MAVLHWTDLLILVSFFVVTVAIGLYQACTGGRQRTVEEFLLDNRKLKVVPTALSLLASARSAVSVLGIPAEIYNWGTQLFFLADTICFFISVIIIECFILPWLHPLKLTSVFEYLYLRYRSISVQRLASALSLCASVLYASIVALSPAVAIEVVTGIPLKTSILLMIGFCMIYTALGGIRGVIWNDTLQSIIMIAGLLFVLVQGCKEVGGFEKVLSISHREGRLYFANFNPDPTLRVSFWSLLFGFTSLHLHTTALQQMAAQRFMAIPTLKKAQIMILCSTFAALVFTTTLAFTGLVQVAYFFTKQCDPYKSGLITSQNQIFPLFMEQHFYQFHGMQGLFLMTICSSTISTVSSVLSANAANTWQDFLKPVLGHRLTNVQATIVIKVLVVLYSVVCTIIALFASHLPSSLYHLAVTFMSITAGPVLGVFFLGGLTRRSEWIGALTGGIAGFFLLLLITCGNVFGEPFQFVSYPPFSTSGCPIPYNHSFSEQFNDTDIISVLNYTSVFDLDIMENFMKTKKPLKGIDRLFVISTFWYTFLGIMTTFIVGYVTSVFVSLLSSSEQEQVEAKYLIPFRQARYQEMIRATEKHTSKQTNTAKKGQTVEEIYEAP